MRITTLTCGLIGLFLLGCASTRTNQSQVMWRLLEPSQHPLDSRTAAMLTCDVKTTDRDVLVDATFRYATVFEKFNLRVVVIDSAVAFLKDATGTELIRRSASSDILLELDSGAYVGKWKCSVKPSELERMRWRIFVGVMPVPGRSITEYVQEFAYPTR